MNKSPNLPNSQLEDNRSSNRIVTFVRFGLIALGLGIAADQFVPNEAHAQTTTQTPIATKSNADSDSDGVLDRNDNCVYVPNPNQANKDTDSFGDACDNCPSIKNSEKQWSQSEGRWVQFDTDGDGRGEPCDLDDDSDGKLDTEEDVNGNGIVDPGETDPKNPDTDGDGLIDSNDPKPLVSRGTATSPNGNPLDTDGDGMRNDVDTDNDGDGMPNAWERRFGLNPLDITDALQDADRDGYTNIEEFKGQSLPNAADMIPNRFNVITTTDPTYDRNHKSNNNRHTSVTDPNWQLPLFPCDDVRRKDRHRRTRLDLNSPSVVFQAIKLLQRSVNTRRNTLADNLGSLGEIKSELAKLSPAGNPYPKGSIDWNRVNDEYLDLLQIYNNERGSNNTVVGKWRNLSSRLEGLRRAIKDMAHKEYVVGRVSKRCYRGWVDFNSPAELSTNTLMPVSGSTPAPNFDDYARQSRNIRNLKGLACATIDHENIKNDTVTNSKIYEQLKFLQKVVFQHMEAAQTRAVIFIQMTNHAREQRKLRSFSTARIYERIIRAGKSRNDEILRSWKRLYAQIVDKETGLKQQVVEAESAATTEFDVIDRCISK